MKRLIPLFVVAAIAALVIAIAGGGSSKAHKTAQTGAKTGPQAGPHDAPQTAAGGGSALALRRTKLGNILVDAKGRSVYLFEADKPNMSNCSGACLSIWPALSATGKAPEATGKDAEPQVDRRFAGIEPPFEFGSFDMWRLVVSLDEFAKGLAWDVHAREQLQAGFRPRLNAAAQNEKVLVA